MNLIKKFLANLTEISHYHYHILIPINKVTINQMIRHSLLVFLCQIIRTYLKRFEKIRLKIIFLYQTIIKNLQHFPQSFVYVSFSSFIPNVPVKYCLNEQMFKGKIILSGLNLFTSPLISCIVFVNTSFVRKILAIVILTENHLGKIN